MYLLGDVFTSEHGEAVTVLQLLTKFKMTLSEIDTYLNEYGNRLNSIEFLNVTQQQEIIILKSQVATLQTKVNSIQLTLGDYLLRFNDLDVQLSVINGKIDSNTTDITSLNTLVSNIQTSITNIANQINTINSQIDGINTRLDISLSSISDLNDSVDAINITLTTLSSSITTLTTSVNDLTTLVNSLQNTCTTLTTDLNLLTSRVTYLETNDTWQNGQISSLTTSTQLNTNNVSALNTLVGGLDDRVDALENNSIGNIGNIGYESNLVSPFTQKSANTITNFGKTPVSENHNLIIEEYVFFVSCSTGTDTNITFTTCLGSKLVTFPTLTGTSNIIKVSYTVFSKFDGINLFFEDLINITCDNTFVKSVSTSSFNDMFLQSSKTWNDRLKIQINKLHTLSPVKYVKHDVELLT